MEAESTYLSKLEEEELMKSLFNFVKRVSSPDEFVRDSEIAILPDMVNLLINCFVKY